MCVCVCFSVCVRTPLRECHCVCVYLQVITTTNCYFEGKQDMIDSAREVPLAASVEVAGQTAGEAAEEPEAEEYVSADEGETELSVDLSSRDPSQQEGSTWPSTPPPPAAEDPRSSCPLSLCLTVQPNRIPCGVR